ncbi:MAG TPA: N-acetylmuramoyl-L-alanine amidase [Casimicrobiaceae bacterium]|nr:N-acetylmuramoyl-L-alanine amidase [Casimicrobiaceae bacterium]
MSERPRRRNADAELSRVSLERRRAFRWLLLPAANWVAPSAWAEASRIASARLWPAQEYTRVIFEAKAPIEHQLVTLRDPDRLVLDLARIEPSPELSELPSHVQPSDPYIAAIRVGTPSSGFLRVVLDLKTAVRPQVFSLPPVAEYGYRLILDLYPRVPVDPLMAFLAREQRAETGISPQAAAPQAAGQPGAQRGGMAAPRSQGQDRRITIAIDPGHGGEDPGAIGRRGTYEKNVALAISRRLKHVLDGDPQLRVALTRNSDYFVPLAERVQKARAVRADLLVSIHADAFTVPTARGSSVFALSEHGATSAAARWLAQRENSADLIGGVNLGAKDPVLARTLLDLSQTAQISDSMKVGRDVLEELGTHNALHKSVVEQAGFAVLKAPDIPSILVETAFISNPDEELKLRNPAQQQRFAESIADGIKGYFSKSPPLARA